MPMSDKAFRYLLSHPTIALFIINQLVDKKIKILHNLSNNHTITSSYSKEYLPDGIFHTAGGYTIWLEYLNYSVNCSEYCQQRLSNLVTVSTKVGHTKTIKQNILVCIFQQYIPGLKGYKVDGGFYFGEVKNTNSTVEGYSLDTLLKLIKVDETNKFNHQLLKSDRDKLLFYFARPENCSSIPDPSSELEFVSNCYQLYINMTLNSRKRFHSEELGNDEHNKMLEYLSENNVNYEEFSTKFEDIDKESKQAIYDLMTGKNSKKKIKISHECANNFSEALLKELIKYDIDVSYSPAMLADMVKKKLNDKFILKVMNTYDIETTTTQEDIDKMKNCIFNEQNEDNIETTTTQEDIDKMKNCIFNEQNEDKYKNGEKEILTLLRDFHKKYPDADTNLIKDIKETINSAMKRSTKYRFSNKKKETVKRLKNNSPNKKNRKANLKSADKKENATVSNKIKKVCKTVLKDRTNCIK
ncbi:hypothetical protein TSAR_005442 [Trichomalopsis sarcophagae]|uniref:Uncharacterized protein n=1 Tax=Trichomalopsis sarcophagae TaxID=543379 RepID=A0A232FA39_9HYME|nr:hypothetical protein TSAR_005442 [Trichomalopsis sarcophagae]